MSPIAIAFVVLACVFGGALLGMFLSTVLPEHHLSEASKDIVKLVTGLIATLAALVLGLLVASAKNSFDTANEGFRQSAARVILLDRTLAQYGPETKDVRELLRNGFAARIDQLFPKDASQRSSLGSAEGTAAIEGFAQRLRALSPQTDAQRALQSRAAGNHRFDSPGALDGDRRGGKHDPNAVSRRAHPLAGRDVRELRPVRAAQRNCSRPCCFSAHCRSRERSS